MNWYIGQDIVAIRTPNNKRFKEGDTFIVLALRQSPCKCNYIDIDIGLKSISNSIYCPHCGDVEKSVVLWNEETNFTPLDTLTNINELNEVLTKEIFEV